MSEVYGLFNDQHRDVGRLVRGSRARRRGRQGVSEKEQTFQPPIRVIAMTDRNYDTRDPELLPIFGYFRTRTVWTVSQVGSALGGYFALIVNGKRWIVECRRENLLDVQVYYSGLRITVFPGLWEFDFGELTEGQAAGISIEVQSITADENLSICELFDDVDSVVFTGSTIVRREAWCSFGLPKDSARKVEPETEGQPEPPRVVHREVVDAIPYSTGTVKRGAIGLCVWSWDAGYICTGWECRTFSHANGYVQKLDPLVNDVEEPPVPDPTPEPDDGPDPEPDPQQGGGGAG